MLEKYVDSRKLGLYSVSEIAEAASQTKNAMYWGSVNNSIMEEWLTTESDPQARKALKEQYGEKIVDMLENTSPQLMSELIAMTKEIAPEQEERIALLMAEIARRGFGDTLPVVDGSHEVGVVDEETLGQARKRLQAEH